MLELEGVQLKALTICNRVVKIGGFFFNVYTVNEDHGVPVKHNIRDFFMNMSRWVVFIYFVLFL